VQRLKACARRIATCASSSRRAPTRTRATREARRGAPRIEALLKQIPRPSRERAADKNAMTVSLLGREFRVGCPEGEQKQLSASVDYLNRKMKEVRDTGKVVGNERIAIMAALNIAHEMMSNPARQRARSPSTARRLSVESLRCRRRLIRRSPPTRTISSRVGFAAVFVRAYIL
jgi:cell division protein ZapA